MLDRGGNPALINEAAVHGYATAIWWAVGLMGLAALIAFTFINTGRQDGAGAAGSGATDDENAGDVPVPVMMH